MDQNDTVEGGGRPELHVYRVFWSEGEPLVIEAPSFGFAVDRYVRFVCADGQTAEEDAVRWIDSIEKLSDYQLLRCEAWTDDEIGKPHV